MGPFSHFFMRKFVTMAALVSMVLPSLAAAAFTEPADIIAGMQKLQQSANAEYEIHVQVPKQNVFISMWVDGAGSGKGADVKATANMTLDVAAPFTKIRAKLQMRVVDGKVYLLVDSVDGDVQHELMSFVAKLQAKKWFMLTVPEEILAAAEEQDETMLGMVRDLSNKLFTMTEKNGTYTLVLKPGAGDQLAELLATMSNAGAVPPMDDPSLTQFLNQVTLDIKARTKADAVTDSSFTMTGRMRESGEVVTIKAMGSFVARSTALVVKAPENAIDLEKYISEKMGLPMGGSTWEDSSDWEDMSEDTYMPYDEEESSSDYDVESFDYQSTEQSSAGMEWNSYMDASCADLEPAERVQALRSGQCGGMHESKRSLNQRLQNASRSFSSSSAQ